MHIVLCTLGFEEKLSFLYNSDFSIHYGKGLDQVLREVRRITEEVPCARVELRRLEPPAGEVSSALETTIHTRRKATGGLPDHDTPFDPHIFAL